MPIDCLFKSFFDDFQDERGVLLGFWFFFYSVDLVLITLIELIFEAGLLCFNGIRNPNFLGFRFTSDSVIDVGLIVWIYLFYLAERSYGLTCFMDNRYPLLGFGFIW